MLRDALGGQRRLQEKNLGLGGKVGLGGLGYTDESVLAFS